MRPRAHRLVAVLCLLVVACSGSPDSSGVEASTTAETAPTVEWTQAPLPEGFDVHTVTAAGEWFVGLSWDEIEDPNPRTRLWLSADGLEWEPVDVDATLFGMRAGYFQHVTAVDGTFIGIVKGEWLTERHAGTRLVGSDDGRLWYPINIGSDAWPTRLAGGPDGAFVLARARDDGENRHEVWHSVDGTDWTRAVPEELTGMRLHGGVAVIGDQYYLVSRIDGQETALLVSTDGSTWSAAELPPLGAGWTGWMFPVDGPNGLILFTGGVGSPRLWQSTEGGWVDVTPEGFEASWLPAGFNDPVVASSDGGPVMIIDHRLANRPGDVEQTVIWWSIDGRPWAPFLSLDARGIVEVAARGKRVVIVDYVRNGPDSLWIGEITS